MTKMVRGGPGCRFVEKRVSTLKSETVLYHAARVDGIAAKAGEGVKKRLKRAMKGEGDQRRGGEEDLA